jgi:hypothetical protein
MKKWIPWAIGGGAVVLFLATRKSTTADAPISTSEIDRLMSEAAATEAFNRLISDLVVTGGGSPMTLKQQYAGPLEVVLDLRVIGFEKLFVGDLTTEAREVAIKIASKLAESCPGAPKLATYVPSIVRISDIDSGLRVRLVWPALWSSETRGPVREEVRACMETLVKASNKKFRERLIRLTASRI